MPLKESVSGSEFTLLAYARTGSAAPVDEFVGQLPEEQQKKVVALLERAAEHGPPKNDELCAHIAGEDFWEFKPGQQRIFWCYAPDRRIILLNGFTKKSKRTPKKELARGRRLCREAQREIADRRERR